MPNPSTSPWSRRRFLTVAGATAVATLSLGAVLDLVGSGRHSIVDLDDPASPLGGPAGTNPAGSPLPGGSGGPTAGARHRYYSRPDLTPPVVNVDVAAGPPAPGLTFLTPNNGAGSDGPLIVDSAGHPVWVRLDSNGVGASTFRPITFEGGPALAWWEGANNNGIGIGEFVVADPGYQEITRIRAVGPAQADHHELLITPQGTALLFSDEGKPATSVIGAGPRPWRVLDCAIQEIDIASGSLLFEWHAIDHIGLDESLVDPPTTAATLHDYVHANSIDIDADGNLIMSARNTSTIYKIDRASGAVIWRLGGRRNDFAMARGSAFSWQHDARRLPGGRLSLFDDSAAPGTSRGIILSLDETARTASLLSEYHHAPPILSTSEGNLQVQPDGHVLVGWGSTSTYTEFSADGRLVMDATIPASATAYRDLRATWVGKPRDRPAVAVVPAGQTLTVYASWNGATEIDRWQVLGGSTADALVTVDATARTGFETAIPVGRRYPLIAVQAIDAGGRILGTSNPIPTPG
jgi:hypothetical protein